MSAYSGLMKLRGEITFENVEFQLSTGASNSQGYQYAYYQRAKSCIVGPSSSGKTTIIKLIPRFYEIRGGSIKIDGRDSLEYPLAVLRQNVSFVLQENVLFDGTILENIMIGRSEATMEEIVESAKQAHIHDTLMSWPDGYNTRVLDRGRTSLLVNANVSRLHEPYCTMLLSLSWMNLQQPLTRKTRRR